MYAAWTALMPSWFTTDLQAQIPDEFMPARIVHELNAQAPDGQRPTLQNMGLMRRVSLATVVTAEGSSNSDEGLRVPAPAHLEACIPAGGTTNRGGVDGDLGEAHDRRGDCCEPCGS